MSAIERIREEARRDARRYSEAQLNYGKGAGTQRRLIDAELKEKMKDEIYHTAFEAALAGINKADVASRIQKKKGIQRAYEGAKKTVRAAQRAEGFYHRNRYWIDQIMHAIFGS